MKVNLDLGIADALYQPSKLLARKEELKQKLEASIYKKKLEGVDSDSLHYMLERLRGE